MSIDDELATTLVDALARYYEHLGRRVNRMAEAIPDDKFWQHPFTFGNSFGTLVVHVTGSLNHFFGAKIAATGYVRHRDREFTDRRSQTAADAMEGFNSALKQTVEIIRSQSTSELMLPVDFSDDPANDRVGLFIVSAGHLNNHIGQMAYLLHAQGIHLDDQTW